MTRSMLAVIEDLADHVDATDPDASPPPEQSLPPGGAVACIAGRGPFDDAVTAMLTQLLGQRGVAVRVIRNAAVSRETIASLDLTGVAVIALSYLQLTGSPAQLRYLIKRIRQRAPAAHIVVGLWPEGEAALGDSASQQAIGADGYVGSLGQQRTGLSPN